MDRTGRQHVSGHEKFRSKSMSVDLCELESERLIGSPTGALPFTIGFYLAFRLFLVLLSVRIFGTEAQTGVEINLALNFLFLAITIFCSPGRGSGLFADLAHQKSVRWAFIFLGFSGCSLLWSSTASLPAAVAYWCAMAADLVMVILLFRAGPLTETSDSLMKGYVWGACLVAITAWLLPAQSDLRLGDEELLGPNQIGYLSAFAFFFAQYLIRKKERGWGLAAILLAVTLIRTLSKTTIVAFLVSQAFLLVKDKSISWRTKLFYILAALVLVVSFSSLFASYYDVYSNAGNQSETLSGRFGIWAYILAEAIEKPWIGHGFHSVWKVIPPFGPDQFEARHAHNELLQQFYAYGVFGICMWILIYGSLYRHIRRLEPGSARTFFFSFLIFALVRGLADTEPFDLSLPLWLIVMITLLIEHARSMKQRANRLLTMPSMSIG